MTNRREFLQIGVTATAWPLVAGTLQAAGLGPAPQAPSAVGSPAVASPAVALSAVVYDTRFPESVAFATRCAALGLETLPIDADMTRLWYDQIYYRWRQGPAAIAGLTAHGPMFCFTELARDVRMRLVFRAEHRLTSSPVAHALEGPQSMVADAYSACERPLFGASMAGVVTRCPIGRSEITSAHVGAHVGAPVGEPDEDALYTWMIAPATRG